VALVVRRDVLLGGTVTVRWLRMGCPCHAQTTSGHALGCYIPSEDAPTYFGRTHSAQAFARGDETLEPRSGDRYLDEALAQALATIGGAFDVLPGFSYYSGPDDDNAYATPEPRLQRTDGTVLFGVRLLKELLALTESRDAAIVSVCAHEFGHVVAYKTGLQRKLVPDASKTYRGEQFADFMAGFFSGLRRRALADYPAVVFATTLRGLAGNTRGTHGTQAERGEAVAEGFKAAYQDHLDAASGIERGSKFALARV
jgi:hypothetical protein